MIQGKNKALTLYVFMAVMLLLPVTLSAGELRFSRYFGDGMVLQRDKPVILTGFASKGSKVTVKLGSLSRATTADQAGQWKVTFDAMGANAKGQKITLKTATDEVSLNDVLIGDVFLFGRQTSIDISLGRDSAGQKAAAAHKDNSLYRAISINTVGATKPQSDLDGKSTNGWTKVDRTSALKMSGAAYYFGRDLAKELKVPVGVIDLNMGHYFPVGWLSRQAQLETAKFYGKTDVEDNLKRMENLAELRSRGEPVPHKEVITSDPKEYALYPAAGYNAVICPLKSISMKGIVLQLGGNYPYMIYAELEKNGTDRYRPELNRAYVETYNIRKIGFRMDPVTTPRIPKVWRDAFDDADLPIAMIMPPGSALNTLAVHGREMRELQRQMAQDNDNLGLILPGYENITYSAQPSDELLLSERSVKWAIGEVYETDEDAAACGPLFDKLETNMNKATIYFKEVTAQGLTAGKGALDVFEAAGIDGEYSPAKARIDGDVIRLVSDTVNRIAHVRYNWLRLPDQTLVNSSGLPAIPFRTENVPYVWFIENTEADLPMEYSTPANEWSKNDVTLVNGQLKTHGYTNFTGWLGPVGIMVGPFGPNMGLREIKAGSPAEGKLFVGDVIYSANGRMLGDRAELVMSSAITESETEDRNGKLVLGVRRGAENLDVELKLDVMGTYSSTSPYDCPKTEKIVDKLEDYLVKGGGSDFLATDTLFLLAAGSPEHQGLVRSRIYNIMQRRDSVNWYLGYNSTLLAEYYLATGDKTVLPHLEKIIERIVVNQIKDTKYNKGRIGGWYGRDGQDRSYPTMPNAGLACLLGMTLAKEAGVHVDETAYKLAIKHFRNKGADVGLIIYGDAYRDRPRPIDPAEMLAGQLSTDNGKVGVCAVIFDLIDDAKTSYICSQISTHSYNNTFEGHGGNFWNNFWSPLGANVHGKEAFMHFWRGHRWYRELNRMFDGSLIVAEVGRWGGGHGLPLVIPRKRLRILGAPVSPFAVNAPEMLKPAVTAYQARDYAGCLKLVNEMLATGTVGKSDLPTVDKLAQAARDVQASIDCDFDKMEALIKEGRMAEASADLAQLKTIVAEDNVRLSTIVKGLKGPARDNDKKLYGQEQKSKVVATKPKQKAVENKRDWKCLVTEIPVGKDKSLGKVPAEEANMWRIKVVESACQAPAGWVDPRFDDSGWKETNLPISWRMYHTSLLRTKFNVEDKNTFDQLRMRGWFFRQQGIEVYLNGELVAKVNNLKKKTGNVEAVLKESALKHLKNGENTLAVTARHNWRWGMLFMHVYNDGFGFRLDGRVKE